MPNDLRALLNYIIENPIMQAESQEAQLDATAVQDVRAEIAAQAQEQRAHADQLAPYFARGLRLAARGPLTLQDTDPEENLIADAFARYLVVPNLATSQSAPISKEHYRYTFEVNWPALRAIAQRAGVNLDAALAEA